MSIQNVALRIILQNCIVCIGIMMSIGIPFCLNASFNTELEKNIHTDGSIFLHDHYQRVCDCVINVWSVLDIMRSINIEPKARVDFIHQLFGDVVVTMREVVALEVGCRMCREYGQHHSDELTYFFDMIDHVENAFEAVFTPIIFGEEKLLAILMLELFEGVKNIKQTLNM